MKYLVCKVEERSEIMKKIRIHPLEAMNIRTNFMVLALKLLECDQLPSRENNIVNKTEITVIRMTSSK